MIWNSGDLRPGSNCSNPASEAGKTGAEQSSAALRGPAYAQTIVPLGCAWSRILETEMARTQFPTKTHELSWRLG